jgi:DNA-binding CsgD family transcriptional regulator
MRGLEEIVKKRLNPGILIFDLDDRLTYANREALDILPSIGGLNTQLIHESQIPKEIYNLCNLLKSSLDDKQKPDTHCIVIESSTGFLCSLRALFLRGSGSDLPTHIMVLIERVAEKHEFDFEKAKGKFKLSKREVEVLRLLCSGDNNKGIAEKLFISEYTVKDHIKKIMEKMGVQSRNEIMALMK